MLKLQRRWSTPLRLLAGVLVLTLTLALFVGSGGAALTAALALKLAAFLAGGVGLRIVLGILCGVIGLVPGAVTKWWFKTHFTQFYIRIFKPGWQGRNHCDGICRAMESSCGLYICPLFAALCVGYLGYFVGPLHCLGATAIAAIFTCCITVHETQHGVGEGGF